MIKIDISQMTTLSSTSSEAYKSLRTNIEFCGTDIKVIALTSCIPKEGKSIVSLNLANSLAELGKKVLFIDADLRKSVLLSRLDITERVQGLTNYLAGQCEIGDILCQTNQPRLQLILAGPVPPNPAELLGSPLFHNTLVALRDAYDYIIIDTPPLGSVVDGAVIARECDGAAIVIAANNVSHRFAESVKEQLERSGCKVLGVILNKVDMSENGYYGRYYGRYYGKYYGKYYGQYQSPTDGKEQVQK